MKYSHKNAHTLISELVNCGIDYFCIAPGSRSTSLSYTIAKKKSATSFVFFDERSLCFHALGYAKAKKKPAVIVVTSGSSLANLYPAIVEAYQDHIPLIILSADRPYTLRDCGANQVMDQVNFFSSHVHFEADLPLMHKQNENNLKSTVSYAISKSSLGPVHLNCQFSEPFIDKDLKVGEDLLKGPHHKFHSSSLSLPQAPNIKVSENGLIILGKDVQEKDHPDLFNLAKKLNYPIFSDILSNARFLDHKHNIEFYDLLIKNKAIKSFDTVIHFEGSYLSKTLLNFLEENPPKQYIKINSHGERQDPNHMPSENYILDAAGFCQKVEIDFIDENGSQLNDLSTQSKQTKSIIEKTFSISGDLSEPYILNSLLKNASDNENFYIASSQPIRNAFFYGTTNKKINIFCNRALSGIDGNLATAFGISQALNQPLTVVIGDLAFMYDLNSLFQIKNLKNPIKIIVINNSGGGIFTQLPIYQEKDIFKSHFQYEHSHNFENMAKMCNIHYQKLESKDDFDKINFSNSFSQIIEITTNNEINLMAAKEIQSQITNALYQNLGI